MHITAHTKMCLQLYQSTRMEEFYQNVVVLYLSIAHSMYILKEAMRRVSTNSSGSS